MIQQTLSIFVFLIAAMLEGGDKKSPRKGGLVVAIPNAILLALRSNHAGDGCGYTNSLHDVLDPGSGK